MTNKILMVLTSHSDLGNTGHKTGFWVEEFAAPYYMFLDSGADITLASPAGGQPPVDPTSALPDFQRMQRVALMPTQPRSASATLSSYR